MNQSSIRTVLETSPLYTKVAVALPAYASGLFPDVLELDCPQCKMSRPFRDPRPSGSGAGLGGPPPVMSTVYVFFYKCTSCNTADYWFWLDINTDGWVRKVGQRPAWSIRVDPVIERHLGDSADHYRRARICLSQSFGLAACAYLRRVLEDTIDPLLRLEREVRAAEGASAAELAEIERAIATHQFETKTEVAYRLAPASIIVDGTNPLKLIHDRLSIGVHRLSEDDCVQTAATITSALEFVVSELNRRRDSRQAFAATLKPGSGSPVRDA